FDNSPAPRSILQTRFTNTVQSDKFASSPLVSFAWSLESCRFLLLFSLSRGMNVTTAQGRHTRKQPLSKATIETNEPATAPQSSQPAGKPRKSAKAVKPSKRGKVPKEAAKKS